MEIGREFRRKDVSSKSCWTYTFLDVAAECPDDFLGSATVKGRGEDKDEAKTNFEKGIKKMVADAKKKLQCENYVCEGGVCEFDYAPADELKCEEKKRKTVLHKVERKWWECTQTFDIGCFCIREA